MIVRKFNKFKTIRLQDSLNEGVIKLVSGRLIEYYNEKAWRIVEPGEAASFSRERNTTTVVAATECEVEIFSNEEIDPKEMMALIIDENTYSRRMSVAKGASLQNRIATILLDTEGLQLKRKEMAEIIACSPEALIRVVSAFEQKGYIKKASPKGLEILQREVLEKLAVNF